MVDGFGVLSDMMYTVVEGEAVTSTPPGVTVDVDEVRVSSAAHPGTTQISSPVFEPLHFLSLHFLVRCLMAIPHVAEHSDQDPHSLQPFTSENVIYINI